MLHINSSCSDPAVSRLSNMKTLYRPPPEASSLQVSHPQLLLLTLRRLPKEATPTLLWWIPLQVYPPTNSATRSTTLTLITPNASIANSPRFNNLMTRTQTSSARPLRPSRTNSMRLKPASNMNSRSYVTILSKSSPSNKRGRITTPRYTRHDSTRRKRTYILPTAEKK